MEHSARTANNLIVPGCFRDLDTFEVLVQLGTLRRFNYGRADVSESASISSGIAERYATAVFEIAKEAGTLSDLESNVADLSTALTDSDDLSTLISSPVYTRGEQGAAMSAVAQKMGLMPAMQNVLGLMASKRRLFALPQLAEQLTAMIAAEKGEVTAEVSAAKALTKTQSAALAKTLKAKFGKEITLNVTVDESLIGGLVVKVGSVMVDSSIKAKLNSLQNAMKEVG